MTAMVLITRPADDAADTACMVDALGLIPLLAPVLAVHDVAVNLPDPALYQAILFSSANGVRSLQRRKIGSDYLDLPVFAVGEHTAQAARQMGFKTVHAAAGTMASMTPLIREKLGDPARLLHVRGRDMREDPAHSLNPAEGWIIDGVVLYQADPVQRLDPAVVAALREGQVQAVLFYSAKSVESFVLALQRDWPDAALPGTKALCLADSVIESARRLHWAEILVAQTPDQVGMTRLLKSVKAMTTSPAAPHDENALPQAEKIIERFGGIRPMATKMNVPVTTVQGWKKRDVIPGNRRADVLNTARQHSIDLTGLVARPVNNFSNTLDQARQEQATRPETLKPHEAALAAARATEAQEGLAARGDDFKPMTYDMMMKEIKRSQVQAVRRSVAAASAVLVLFGVVGGLLIVVGKQQVEKSQARIAALENTIEEIEGKPAAGAGVIADMGAKFTELQASVADLKNQAQDLIGPENASLAERLMTLEQKLQALTGGSTDLSLVLQRIQEMQTSLQGQQQMQDAMGDLQGLVSGLQGRMDTIDTALAEEQQTDSALGQALEGVSPQELKAAAMLIGLSQFRDSMNRSGPFDNDLALLQKMLGDKDPELNAEIARLAPYAEKGVLSPKGLSNELKGLAGDIVVSSISGEEVSIQDKALTRFHDVLKIQKDGQPVMGTDTQATVARAQQLLDAGDVDSAVLELQRLQGPARETAQPLIDEAQITAMAQKVQGLLTNNVMGQIRLHTMGSAPYTAKPSPLSGSLMGPGLMDMPVAPSLKTSPVPPQSAPAAPLTTAPVQETPATPTTPVQPD